MIYGAAPRRRLPRRFRIVVAAMTLAMTASGCAGATASPHDGKIRVVASTNVYGSIVETVGGERVSVTSVLGEAAQNPHSYEANARVQLALSRADLVIENGGGYDDFMNNLLSGANNSAATVLNVAEVSGYSQSAGFNEHLWYDFPTIKKVVDVVVSELSARSSADAASFRANGKTLTAALDGLITREATLRSQFAGVGIAITEPVPLYLLEASGLTNRTPPAFSAAIEAGSDVAPAILQQTLDLFSSRAVSMLAYNEQTSGADTEKLKKAAGDAGIAVVGFTETLPSGDEYVSWMRANLDTVERALS